MKPSRFRHGKSLAYLLLTVTAATVALLHNQEEHRATLFFVAGTGVLLSGLFWIQGKLNALRHNGEALSLKTIGFRTATRKPGRSLAVISILAMGCFLVLGVGTSGKDPSLSSHDRGSGTGGFTWLATVTLPIQDDIQTVEGRQELGIITDSQWQGIPIRVRLGDDASCKSLGQAQQPTLMGINPQALASRGAFAFKKERESGGWNNLTVPLSDNEVPAIGDEATIVWGLHLGLGDTLEYLDEQGNPFTIRIVGIIGNSILQGGLLMDETHFTHRFPSESGITRFLIDAPPENTKDLEKQLQYSLVDKGLVLTRTEEKLAEFSGVENTYMKIFGALGGLGLLLGCMGVGLVLGRNIVDRQKELAILRAIGFSHKRVKWMLLTEHGVLLFAGLFLGGMAAMIGVWPTLAGPDVFPYLLVLQLMASMLFVGMISTWLAATFSLRQPLLDSLKKE